MPDFSIKEVNLEEEKKIRTEEIFSCKQQIEVNWGSRQVELGLKKLILGVERHITHHTCNQMSEDSAFAITFKPNI